MNCLFLNKKLQTIFVTLCIVNNKNSLFFIQHDFKIFAGFDKLTISIVHLIVYCLVMLVKTMFIYGPHKIETDLKFIFHLY